MREAVRFTLVVPIDRNNRAYIYERAKLERDMHILMFPNLQGF